jgi:hypothetical protein
MKPASRARSIAAFLTAPLALLAGSCPAGARQLRGPWMVLSLFVGVDASAQTCEIDSLVLDAAHGPLPQSFSSPPALWASKPSANAAALILDKSGNDGGILACIGSVDSSGGDDGDFATGYDNQCGTVFTNGGTLRTPRSMLIGGGIDYRVNPTTGVVSAANSGFDGGTPNMLGIFADIPNPALIVAPGQAKNSALVYWQSRDSTTKGTTAPHVVSVFDDDSEGDEDQEGFSIWFCDPDDLADLGSITFDFDHGYDTIHADSGSPFARVRVGDRIAVRPYSIKKPAPPTQFQTLLRVVAKADSANITVADVPGSGSSHDRYPAIYRCDQRIYRKFSTGEITVKGTLAADDALTVPHGSDCPASCSVGQLFMDTDSDTDLHCTSSFSGAVCGCYADDTWGCP